MIRIGFPPIQLGRARASRAAVTLAETVLCMVIISVMLVGAMRAVAAAKSLELSTNRSALARQLAQDLMAEIRALPYEDPGGSPAFGREGAEKATSRADWNDIDDYDGWSAAPPEGKDGSPIAGLSLSWSREVSVKRVSPANLQAESFVDFEVKQITVTVRFDGNEVARSETIRTSAWPSGAALVTQSLLMVVDKVADPSTRELDRKALIESWGWVVTLIDDSATQGEFDSAFAQNDVLYVPATIDDGELDTKLIGAPIGIVNEETKEIDEIGLASTFKSFSGETEIKITDNTHFITSPFSSGTNYSMFDGGGNGIYGLDGTLGAGVQSLARQRQGGQAKAMIAVLETGGATWDFGTAPARRVWIPWGNKNLDIPDLSPDAETIMQRSIEWAAAN